MGGNPPEAIHGVLGDRVRETVDGAVPDGAAIPDAEAAEAAVAGEVREDVRLRDRPPQSRLRGPNDLVGGVWLSMALQVPRLASE